MHRNKTKGNNNQQKPSKKTTRIKNTKKHGAGNDNKYVDTTRYPIADPEKKAIEWSKFHTGIGGDGLILIGVSNKADYSLHIFFFVAGLCPAYRLYRLLGCVWCLLPSRHAAGRSASSQHAMRDKPIL